MKALDPRLLEDDAQELMLYDPSAPSITTTLDDLPGSPHITAGGELEARRGFALHLVVMPVAFVCLTIATAARLL